MTSAINHPKVSFDNTKPSWSSPHPLLIAHRGASDEAPENTLEAFRLALSLSAHAIETDVHMTKDGYVVVSHDESGSRMAGVDRTIASCTYSETQTWDMSCGFRKKTLAASQAKGKRQKLRDIPESRMPLLEEVLIEFSGIPISVDAKAKYKNQEDLKVFLQNLLSVISRCGATSEVKLASFSRNTLKMLKCLGWEGRTAASPFDVICARCLPEFYFRLHTVAFEALHIPVRSGPLSLCQAPFISKIHRQKKKVHYWVINDPKEAEKLLSLGADGVITDDVRSLKSVFYNHLSRIQSSDNSNSPID